MSKWFRKFTGKQNEKYMLSDFIQKLVRYNCDNHILPMGQKNKSSNVEINWRTKSNETLNYINNTKNINEKTIIKFSGYIKNIEDEMKKDHIVKLNKEKEKKIKNIKKIFVKDEVYNANLLNHDVFKFKKSPEDFLNHICKYNFHLMEGLNAKLNKDINVEMTIIYESNNDVISTNIDLILSIDYVITHKQFTFDNVMDNIVDIVADILAENIY